MSKPDTIIYSDTIFNALCLELNPAGGGVPPGAKAKAGGLSLAWVEETVEVSLQVPEAGVAISEQETVWKVRAGSLADVAPVAFAHGSDMATYKTIIFDLDFELGERAIHRIVELNMGVTGDGRNRTPVTWPTLAAQDHLILVVLARSVNLAGSPAQKRLSPSIGNPPSTNYDLIHGLPFKFKPLQDFGRVLAPTNYALKDDVDKKLRPALEQWIKQGTAFRVLDLESTPMTVGRSMFCSTPSEGPTLWIAGAFRYENSLLGFLPATNLDPVSWLKAASKISEALNRWRKSQKNLSEITDASTLERIVLVVRPKANPRKGTNPVEVIMEFEGEKIPVKIPARGKSDDPGRKGRGPSNYGQDHLRLIEFAVKNEWVKIESAVVYIDWGWPTTKFSQAMNELRDGMAVALKAAKLSEALAYEIFPTGQVGVAKAIKRNIRISGPRST